MEKQGDIETVDVFFDKDTLTVNPSLLKVEDINHKHVYRFLKRIMDISGSSVGQIVLSH